MAATAPQRLPLPSVAKGKGHHAEDAEERGGPRVDNVQRAPRPLYFSSRSDP
jgi:hypothetical protein